MALIKCPECGKEISDKAISCPHCGVPIAGQLTKNPSIQSTDRKDIICPSCGNTLSNKAIFCPHCGKTIENSSSSSNEVPISSNNKPISSNTVSVSSSETDSGVETFHVEAGNRLELSAKADAEIQSRTIRLSAEGKNVVNIQKSDPQPFTFGVTVWKMDITLLWNASLSSERYKQTVYEQAVSLADNGYYQEAIYLFEKIPDYKDVKEQKEDCQNCIDIEQRRNAIYQAEKKEIEENIGTEPSYTCSLVTYCLLGFLLLLAGALLVSYIINGPSKEYNFYTGEHTMNYTYGILGGIGIIVAVGGIVCRFLYTKQYKKKVEEYRKNKHTF